MDSIFQNVINAFLSVFLSCLFYGLFGNSRLSIAIRIISLVTAIATFAFVLYFIETGFTRFLILFIIIFAISFLFSMKTLHRLLYSLLYISLCVISEGITAMFVSMVFSVDINHGTEGMLYVLGALISKLIVLFVIILIRLKRHKSLVGISIKHIVVLLLIPLSTLMLLVLQYNYDYIVALPSLWTWFLSIAYLLLVISNISVFDYIDSLYQNTLDSGKLIATAQIIKEQEKQYIAIQQHYNEIVRFRHDQKNITIGILNELREGNTSKAIEHLQECISILSAENIRSVGIIHSVVDIKSKLAKEKGVRLNFEYRNLQKITLSDIDIAVLLGNALDNAIEATTQVLGDLRCVNLLITIQNNNLVIYIKNPVAGDIDVNTLPSKKGDRKNHGFGIISMKQIVDNFHGDIVFHCEDHYFEVHIVLPNVTNSSEHVAIPVSH